MASGPEIAVRRALFGLLWMAAWVVPAERRSEWSQEWRSELRYALRDCFSEKSPDPRAIRKAIAFSMGAYRDAAWLRRRAWQNQQLVARTCSSPWVCLALLTGMFVTAWGIAQFSAAVAAGMSSVKVHPWRAADSGTPPCDCAADFLAGPGSLGATRVFFDGFSHYTITRETVRGKGVPRADWTVAHAGSDFFTALHLPIRFVDHDSMSPDKLPQIVLSRDTWNRVFRSRRDLAGAKLRVGSVDGIVAGVAFGSSMGLPGGANAWLLGSDSPIGNGNAEFVAGHLSRAGYFNEGRWTLSVGGILLAFLVLPFLALPTMGEHGSRSQRPSFARRTQSWGFLTAKILVLTAMAYFVSVDLSCLVLKSSSPFSIYLQAGSAFAISLCGLCWAYRDQQRRCPICLRPMAHRVNVGQPSQTFLGWNGAELACERGHTLLHIPAIPTSWFGKQRWVYLDRSWQFLFDRTGGTSRLS